MSTYDDELTQARYDANTEPKTFQAAEANTDRELYRETDATGNGDYYSDSVHVTEDGKIGMNAGGYVAVKTIAEWVELAWPKEQRYIKDRQAFKGGE